MSNSRIIWIAALLALIGGIAVQHQSSSGRQTVLPDFSLEDVSGNPQAISQWQGKIRVINFWATWCPPCKKEIPELIAVHDEYAGQGVVVIGIALDDPEEVARYQRHNAIHYPLLMAGNDGVALSRLLGNTAEAIAFTVIADRAGRIVYRHPGELNKAKLQSIIAPLLNATEK